MRPFVLEARLQCVKSC